MPDREKVLKALEHHKETAVCNGCPYAVDDDTPQGKCPVYDDAIAMLKEQPEIVRCKDCKHGEIDTAINGVLLSITCDGVNHSPDWFCADGERRDDDA